MILSKNKKLKLSRNFNHFEMFYKYILFAIGQLLTDIGIVRFWFGVIVIVGKFSSNCYKLLPILKDFWETLFKIVSFELYLC